jgi:hypothetical protein
MPEGHLMKWYPLTLLQIIILLILVALIDVFTIVQKDLVPETARPFSYLLVVFIVLLAYFFMVLPGEPMVLATTLAVTLGIIALVLILVQDVIIAYTISWRTGIVILGAVAGPLVAGYCYAKICPPAPAQ